MRTHEDTERTYLGTQLDIWLRSRVIDENALSGLRIFQTDASPK